MSRHPVLLAVVWMGGVLLSFMAMAVAGRELSEEMGTLEILAWRSIVGLVIVSILFQYYGWSHARTSRPWLHLLRNSAHFLGQYGWFYGIALIPLSEVFAIEFTVPIWAALLAVLILGEKMSRARWLAIGFGIAGTLLILRPGMQVVHPAAFVVLAGAIGYSVSHVLTKKLIQTDAPLNILLFMTIMQLPMALIPAYADMTLPSLSMLPWIVLVGSTALTAHYCMARAFLLADATVVVPLDFLRLPLIGVVGYLFYGERIDLLVFAGALLMLVGNYINIRAATR